MIKLGNTYINEQDIERVSVHPANPLIISISLRSRKFLDAEWTTYTMTNEDFIKVNKQLNLGLGKDD